MSFSVSSLQIEIGEIYYFSDEFRNVIENHLTYLKNISSTRLLPIPDHSRVKYVGDFYGLLQEMGVRHDMFWICLRVNGLHEIADSTDNMVDIFIPSKVSIDTLLNRYLTN